MQLVIDLPPTDQDLFGHTTCGYDGCNKMIPQSKAITGCLQVGRTTKQDHFCSSKCRDKWRDQYFRGVPYDG